MLVVGCSFVASWGVSGLPCPFKAFMIFSWALICVSCCAHFLLSSSRCSAAASEAEPVLQQHSHLDRPNPPTSDLRARPAMYKLQLPYPHSDSRRSRIPDASQRRQICPAVSQTQSSVLYLRIQDSGEWLQRDAASGAEKGRVQGCTPVGLGGETGV